MMVKSPGNHSADPLYQKGNVTVTKSELIVGNSTHNIADLRGFKEKVISADGLWWNTKQTLDFRRHAFSYIFIGVSLMLGATAMLFFEESVCVAKFLLVLSLILIGLGYVEFRMYPIRHAIQITVRSKEPGTGVSGNHPHNVVVSKDPQVIKEIGSALRRAQYLVSQEDKSGSK
jgi:hypothetical protein